ncbi:MAG: VWA domain-containing protein [Rhodanobacter sp.]
MSAALQAFHFLQPWWLMALLGVPLAWWLASRRGAASIALSRLVDAALLPHLLRGEHVHRPLVPWAVASAWMLAVLALAGPTWSQLPQPLYADRATQIVALSLSSHMRARDVVPSRLDRARFKVRDLLAANDDGLNALLAYAGEAFVVAPLTSDADSLHELLAALDPDTMPVDGDNAAAAITQAVTLARDAGAADASLVLVTDQADAAAVRAARAALAAGVRVSVLGVGTPRGGPVPQADGGLAHDQAGNIALAPRNDASLQALASAGGGRYVPMSNDRADIDALRAQLRRSSAKSVAGRSGDAWLDRGPWLLLPLLLLVAMGFRRSWLFMLALVVLPSLPSPAQAGTWTDLWHRPDQQAAAALRRGDARHAQAVARDPAWRGAAAYRAGDYTAAAQALQRAPGATAAYNRGNALARGGQFDAALAAYDQALQLDPNLTDAKANREAVQQWLRRKQQDVEKKRQQQAGQGDQQKQPDSTGTSPGQSQSSPSNADADSSAGENDGPGKPSSSASTPSHADAGQNAKPAAGASPPPAPSTSAADAQPDQNTPPTPQQQAAQRAQADQAQQGLRTQMDKAMQARPGKPDEPVHDLGAAVAGDPQAKLPEDVQRALRNVPDDPGALLRRKFELEYQQRHGRLPDVEDQQ